VNGALKILLVDDNPDDRALVMRELSRELPNSQFRHVKDVKELLSSLEAGPCDLVVTDYQLLWTDGISVLNAVKARWPECPVIMFTGTGSEEIAVRAMKAGLDDYVLKSPKHYARLPAAAHLALERTRQDQALREAETRYQTLFNDVPVGLFRVGRDGRFIDVNGALANMLAYTDRRTLTTIKIRSLFVRRGDLRTWVAWMRRNGEVRQFETQLRRFDNAAIWIEANVRAVVGAKGRALYFEGSVEDITARKQTEQALLESEARKGAILDSAPDAVITIDDCGKVTEFNPAAEKMFGYKRSDVLGRELAEVIVPPALREKHRVGLARYLATGHGALLGKRIEMTAMRANGKQFPVELAVTKVHLEGPAMFTGFVRDITDRKRAEQQLRDSREQLRALAAYLQSVREEERTRIAREVHDELGQTLTGLKMDLAWLDKRISGAGATGNLQQTQEKLKELPHQVDAIIGTVRKIATELRPPVLDDLGLEAAIEWQLQEFQKRTGIKCHLESRLRHPQLEQERATAVFRIFQETLTNILRHAEATRVNVTLREERDQLVLDVQDNGRGVAGQELSGSKSLGLLGMRERATMLDGEVNIIGRQGKGTTVGVRIPLHRAGEVEKK
jgi:PAS domain S-box-containing protein